MRPKSQRSPSNILYRTSEHTRPMFGTDAKVLPSGWRQSLNQFANNFQILDFQASFASWIITQHTLLRSSPTGRWSWAVPLSDGTFNQHSKMYDRKRHGSTPHVSAHRYYKYGITMRDHTINPLAAFKLASQTLSTCFVTDCQAVKLILRILTVVHDSLLIMAGVNRYEEYVGL